MLTYPLEFDDWNKNTLTLNLGHANFRSTIGYQTPYNITVELSFVDTELSGEEEKNVNFYEDNILEMFILRKRPVFEEVALT